MCYVCGSFMCVFVCVRESRRSVPPACPHGRQTPGHLLWIWEHSDYTRHNGDTQTQICLQLTKDTHTHTPDSITANCFQQLQYFHRLWYGNAERDMEDNIYSMNTLTDAYWFIYSMCLLEAYGANCWTLVAFNNVLPHLLWPTVYRLSCFSLQGQQGETIRQSQPRKVPKHNITVNNNT